LRLRRKARLFPGRFDLSKLASTRTLRAFDEYYTAPDAGYAGAADYYERTGARHVLQRITVPTLILIS
jgi:predicted alpha/beta-fold hydrolase